MARRRSAREARRRQIETAPEEVDRAGLADEAGLEALQHAVGLAHRPPQQLRVARVVRAMPLVLVERNGVSDLDRMGRDGDVDAAASKPRHELAIEPRDGTRLEDHREGAGVAVGDVQTVLDEVEIHLERSVPVRDRRGRQAAGGHVQRHVPPVVERRRQSEPDLADDLDPPVQGRDGRLPVPPGQLGPPGGRRVPPAGVGSAFAGHGRDRRLAHRLANSPSSGSPASSQSSRPPE